MVLSKSLKKQAAKTLEQVNNLKNYLEEFYKEVPSCNLTFHTIYIPYPTDEPKSKYNKVSPYANIPISNWPKLGEEIESAPEGFHSRWYEFEDKYLQHLLSIDIRTVHALGLQDFNVVSLFIYDIFDHDAFEPFSGEAYVYLIEKPISKEILHPKSSDWSKKSTIEPFYFNVLELKVPKLFFVEREEATKLRYLIRDTNSYVKDKIKEFISGMWEGNNLVSKIRSGILGLPAYIGGHPLWLQDKEHIGNFIMQFSNSFVPINLGNSGIMYLFWDTAFYQSY